MIYDIPTLTSEAIGLLKSLIAIPSLSRDEEKAADYLQNYIEMQGMATGRKGNNVWCLSPMFDLKKPTLLLNSHIDTVKPVNGWRKDPFKPTLESNGKQMCIRDRIDADLHPPVYTKVGPCLFEYMGQRKEVHGNILVCHERQSDIMNAESLSIIEMMEHDTFRLTGSTGSIKDIGEVII